MPGPPAPDNLRWGARERLAPCSWASSPPTARWAPPSGPLSSLDLAPLVPLYYTIWDKIASAACRETGAIKEKVNAAWQELEPDFVRRIRPCLEAVVGTKGGHIK